MWDPNPPAEITPEMRHFARCCWLWIACVLSAAALMYGINEVLR